LSAEDELGEFRSAMIFLVPFDRSFLDRSWDWLRDPEIKRLTMAPDFTRADQLAFFAHLPAREDYKIWGVVADTRPIGAAGIKNISAGSGEAFLYIGDKSWWGRGAGVEILQLCEAKARDLGLTELRMEAAPWNERSVRAFEKAGFIVQGSGDDDLIRMAKQLAPTARRKSTPAATQSRGRLVENEFMASNLDLLFNQPEYFRLHDNGTGRFFQWQEGERIVGAVHFTSVAEGIFRSPALGTFGGYSFDGDPNPPRMLAFHDAVEERLREIGARELEILLAPADHDQAAFATVVYVLQSRGFQIGRTDLNYSLEVNDQPFERRISYGNRKRLKKCAREGVLARQFGNDRLDDVYEVIARNRAQKNYPVSMTLEGLREMVELFPDRFSLFGAEFEGALIASAVCIALTGDILYVFYWGDLPGHSERSPIVPVAEQIYSFAQEHGFRLLDAGISTVAGEPNLGLIHFKRGLGFSESLKLRMTKALG
jgi:RimJ/RimL family protein N-acetyltransferase